MTPAQRTDEPEPPGPSDAAAGGEQPPDASVAAGGEQAPAAGAAAGGLPRALADRFPPALPTTGAWQPGDPPGDRRFVTVTGSRPFALEGAGRLDEVRVAYETWGELDRSASNAVLVCHALTGDSHAAGDSGPSHPTGGWWSDLIGPGRALDTDRYHVVCSNVLGGCQGTTGPADLDPSAGLGPSADLGPSAGRRYGPRFPTVTVRDMVRVQARLADRLGIGRWLAVVGGSMGGMQVLEWAVMYPGRVRSILPLATAAAASPLQIAWSAIGRLAVVNDPGWNGGDYYDRPAGPAMGLAIARQLAQVTYRSGEVFDQRFGRDLFDPENELAPWGRFQIESYLDHHGRKLVRRFDANAYLVLNRAMDLHDLGRGRGGAEAALARIGVPVLTASITSDRLYPPDQQEQIRRGVNAAGGDCRLVMIDSPQGHDGFLLETESLEGPVADFLEEMEKADA